MTALLFLYSNWMPYNDAIANALADQHGSDVTVVRWNQHDNPRRTWAQGPDRLKDRSSMAADDLLELVQSCRWDAVVVSGRMDDGYLSAASKARSLAIPVVGGSDEYFLGTLRQRLKIAARKLLYQRYFDYLWVPGPAHEKWAIQLGYDGRIIRHLYSGDTEVFDATMVPSAGTSLPRPFLFIGRPVPAKAVDVLLDAFSSSALLEEANARLTLIGGSDADYGAVGRDGVTCVPFSDQASLADHASQSLAFVLPSRREPWGVVVHEMAAAGLPLILSDAVGARFQFLDPTRNGRLVRANDVHDLREALEDIARRPDEAIKRMGQVSRMLSRSTSPAIAAESLVLALSGRVQDQPPW